MIYLEKFTGWNKISENGNEDGPWNEDITEDIHFICEKYLIKNYTINPDGTVDVDGTVDIRYNHLRRLPLRFGSVSGSFYCGTNDLTKLDGAPRYVGNNFSCKNNDLTSLSGCPREIGGYFDCYGNSLETLIGAPDYVGADFHCGKNRLVTLEGITRKIGGDFGGCIGNPVYHIYELFGDINRFMDSLDWNYIRGNEIIRASFNEACEEAGITAPSRIKGYKYI